MASKNYKDKNCMDWQDFYAYYDYDLEAIYIEVDGVAYEFQAHHAIELIQELSTALVEANGGSKP